MVTESSLVIPPRPIVTVASEALQELDASARRLADWGVNIPDDSRLHKARAILAAAVDTGALAPAHRGDDLGLRALELQVDYSAISTSLPPTRVADFRKDLEQSLKGQLDPPEAERGPAQLQSQAMVRAAFVRSGLDPQHPTTAQKRGRRSPDQLLENGLSTYGIEAKRPQRAENIVRRLRDGCDQLADFGVNGGVLVDASDCVRGLDASAASSLVRDYGELILDEVFESGVGARPGYGHVMLAGTYARLAWSSEDHSESSMVQVHTVSRVGIFAPVRGSLRDHRARWIRTHFQTGLHGLTGSLAR